MLKKLTSHRLFKNTSALIIMQLFTYVAPFIVLPYLSRTLGADGFGLMIAALSLTVIANVCTDFGFNLSATYLISRKQNQTRYISKVITAIYSLKLLLLSLVFFGIALYLIFAVNYTALAIAAIYLTVFFQAFLSPWLFQGIEKMKLITYSTIASRMVYVVIVFLLVKHKDDYDLALMCNAIATMLACFLANWLIKKEGFSLVKPSKRLIKLMFTHSSQFFVSRVALQASSSISVLVLNTFVTPTQVGIYGASDKLFNAFKSLINPFSQALYPYMANTGNTKLLFKFTALLGLAMLIPAGIGFYFAEEVIALIYGIDFIESANILRIFIVTGFFAFFSILYGYPAFASIKRVDLANKSVIISGSTLLVVLIALASFQMITIMNVAYTILSVELLTLFLRIYWFKRIRK
ncbi:oligosaccharide flippase family protein [Sinimarinibacterium sp. NLF-5-8]|uniref:oligosaccharide flippase family protein n=1 Tax=Sinimarinibacterium sp. NLF-5-8 TaxID=2698684 RepID=UPI00137BEC24|nr:oligosaccharide flippase family protein [Sinimarinibacterium sp. NLF-5-8]QHS09401.1 oligosaccharide flippase family protein [Sinimarinibacterium sp. NLF-5-8]